jgi:hypothetical protein
MVELIILESLVCLFLFLPLIRPFVKNLWSMDGLVWLPVLALGITLALFPAYGFRPECIPLMIYTVIFNIINVPQLQSLLGHMKNDDFRERNRGLTALLILFLAFVTAIGVYFTPREGTALITEGVSSIAAYDETRNNKYFLRVYGPLEPGSALRPVLLLAPPITGSVPMVDRLCASLRDGGFTVVSYSRLDFDFPAVDQEGKFLPPPLMNILNLFRSYTRGRVSEAANSIGRSLETERQEDIRFLLALMRQNRGIPGYTETTGKNTDWNCVFAAGYGAGGSALVSLAGENTELRGIIAIESPLLSAFKGTEQLPAPELSRDANWFRSLWAGISGWVMNLGTRKITGVGAVPNPLIPVCFIVSDRVQNAKYQKGRYAALLQVFDTSAAPVVLSAVSGAGILDYSDVPEKYPIYSVLFPGQNDEAWTSANYIPGTAALITNFAASVLEQEASLPRKSLNRDGIYQRTRGGISP